MSWSDYPTLGAEIARARERFQHPVVTSKPATMTQSAQTTIPPNHHKALALSHSKMKWSAIYSNLTKNTIVRLPHPRSGESQGQEIFLVPS